MVSQKLLLMPHIPVTIWAWLKKKPLLSPIHNGWWVGTANRVVHMIQELEDVLLVWLERNSLDEGGFDEMCTSIREDPGRIEGDHAPPNLTRWSVHLHGFPTNDRVPN